MRIVIHTQYYPPEMGAPQARMSHLARSLVEAGHTVTVLTAAPNYPCGRAYPGYSRRARLFQRENCDGLSVIRTFIYPARSNRLIARLANYFSFVFSSFLIGAVALPRADFLMTESPPLFAGLAGFLLSRLKGARWIFNVSDLWPESAVRLGAIGPGLSLRLGEWIESFCYRKAWAVTGQSREILDDIRRRFPGVATYHLSNGVDTGMFHPLRCSAEARAKLAGGKPFVALYAGLFGIAQGLDQVLDAAGLLLQDRPEIQIVLMGEGVEKHRLMLRKQEMGLSNVTFQDALAHNKMPAVLASADIALVPLKGRLVGAVPSKIYEAMASGVPVLLIAEGEAADIINGSGAGIAVAPGNPHLIAAALVSLLADNEARVRMGEAGRRAAVGSFDRGMICDAFVRWLEDQTAVAVSKTPAGQVTLGTGDRL